MTGVPLPGYTSVYKDTAWCSETTNRRSGMEKSKGEKEKGKKEKEAICQ